MAAINSVSGVTSTYDNYSTKAVKAAEAVKTEDKKAEGIVYEKSSDITKMSESDRAALVKQLKADQAARKEQFTSLVMDMIGKQGSTFAIAQDDEDSIWKFIASGDYTVDEAAKAEAQEAISEDGYWGVEQTSQRIFDFALALTGGDEDKMDDMLDAFEKGFKEATKSWGSELPDISQKTKEAVYAKFEEFKNPTVDEETMTQI